MALFLNNWGNDSIFAKANKFFLLITVLLISLRLYAQKSDTIRIVKPQYNITFKEKRAGNKITDRSELTIKISIYQSSDTVVNPSFEIKGMAFILDKSGGGLMYIKPGVYKIGCRYLPFDTNDKVRMRIKKGYDYFIEFVLKKGGTTND